MRRRPSTTSWEGPIPGDAAILIVRGVAGFAKVGATVTLAEKDIGTLLSYQVEAQIGASSPSSDSA